MPQRVAKKLKSSPLQQRIACSHFEGKSEVILSGVDGKLGADKA